ncbi:MAG TPA: phosphoglycerate dehydrogenase [Terriglobales bacterium]|nr:phosphoglycerate dehydrogenase [Terriglobales bacterium]
MKILVAEKISQTAINLLRSEPQWTVLTADQIGGDLPGQLGDADALIVRSAVQVDSALLEHASRLRVIGRAGVGVDNVDLDAATRKGIAVMNTPGANAVAVAEHTLGLMLNMARLITKADCQMHAAKWEKKSLQGSELRGKVLGVVGLGRIGVEVAKRAQVFGMTVVAHDPFISATVADQMGVRLAPLDELLAISDHVTLHLGLTPQTERMINAESIARMKKGARIVNCARGELVDEGALIEALKSGHLAGAAMDVFCQEPPAKDSPLLEAPNLIMTPHVAGSTHEAQEAVGVQIAQQVREYLARGVIQNAVNVPSVTAEEYAEMYPYLMLAERLGSFLAQSTEGSLEHIELIYSGRIANWRTELVRNSAIMGVLNQMLSEKANVVNAASIADARGIRFAEHAKPRTSGGGAGDVITLRLRTRKEEHLVRGTVLHGVSPRMLAIDNIDIETRLEQNVIYLRNRDVPGVVGQVGTILARHGINIADFSLGRGESNGKANVREAVAVVRVDGPVPDGVISELRNIEAVTFAKAIVL